MVRSVEGRHHEAFWWWDRPEGCGADNCAGLRGFFPSPQGGEGSRCGARGFASQAETREAPGPRPGGIRTALPGAGWTGIG
jgi:hypothetical protein